MRGRGPLCLLFLGLLAALPACTADEISFAGPAETPGPMGSIDVDGQRRSYLLYVPEGEPPDDGWPLVIAAHGLGGNPARMRGLTRFDATAEREGFVVVYPEGLARAWLDAGIGQTFGDTDIATRNIAFIEALIDALDDELGIDQRRVYVAGLSNGGMFAFHTACELSERVAAVGLVAAASITQSFASCAPEEPVAYIAFHGTADDIVPYEGGPIVRGIDELGEFQPAHQAAAFWTDYNGCSVGSTEEALPDTVERDASTATRETWAPCDAGTSVTLITLLDAGHTWPGHPPPGGSNGETNLDIDATEMLWEFFAAHPKTD